MPSSWACANTDAVCFAPGMPLRSYYCSRLLLSQCNFNHRNVTKAFVVYPFVLLWMSWQPICDGIVYCYVHSIVWCFFWCSSSFPYSFFTQHPFLKEKKPGHNGWYSVYERLQTANTLTSFEMSMLSLVTHIDLVRFRVGNFAKCASVMGSECWVQEGSGDQTCWGVL